MAGIRITDLPANEVLNSNDTFLKVSGVDNKTYKVSGNTLINSFSAIKYIYNVGGGVNVFDSSQDTNAYFNTLNGVNGVDVVLGGNRLINVGLRSSNIITNTMMQTNSVSTQNIFDASITLDKLSPNAIGYSRLTSSNDSESVKSRVANAWINFNGVVVGTRTAPNGMSISVPSYTDTGTWTSPTDWDPGYTGAIVYITSIASVPNARLGGVDVATAGIKILSVSGRFAQIKLLGGATDAGGGSISGNSTAGLSFVYVSSGIRSSYNISSVTKLSQGVYSIYFEPYAISSTSDYCFVSGIRNNLNIYNGFSPVVQQFLSDNTTASYFTFRTTTADNAAKDFPAINIVFFQN